MIEILMTSQNGTKNELFVSSVAYLASIDKVEDEERTIYGRFHSYQGGDFKSFLRFHGEMERSLNGSRPKQLWKRHPNLYGHKVKARL
jgi:hypothetical protein